MELSESLGKLSHHAYAIVGGANARADLLSFLEREHGVLVRGNPDLLVQKYEVLTIDDARLLKLAHATRPFSSSGDRDDDRSAGGGRKFFIIEIDSITHEAQNALLKMFEEPNDYARFFLIIPSEELLLPTLRSRLSVVHTRVALVPATKGSPCTSADFFASSPAERIAFADKLAADISDDKKPKSAALEFCAELSRHLRADGIEKNLKALAAISEVESYLRDRAPSVKQLLEYIALCS